jgi:cytochrome c oxidase subunit 3
MPATFTRTPTHEIERKDTGIGGRPPVDKRPTGGGGGDENWDKHGHGRRGPRELLTRYRMALIFGLSGDLMFFIAIISAFFARQATGHFNARSEYVLDWRPIAMPSILFLNSAIILISSVTVEFARHQLFRETDVMAEWLGIGRPMSRRAAPWLAATIALGLLFLGGQWIAWKQLSREGVFFSGNPASHFFYLITGAHGAHLVLGLLALGAAIGGLFWLKRVEYRQILVDCTAWYWHSMGLFWFFLFGLLLFCQ